ncbi:hypothetical protein HWQ46_11670 [Shewanella sp. D64]|uniref:hypothetical protein n=1 Tax=unclassified Shewanella TaxID=196818 RepID=UPI0022BA174E|nr:MULTISPECIES: hypothetical protein [unclassified Shewanella]MEC4726209.1 hypothetical protein [Shewanella sp. D64]MEC4738221.1 hypothetical protein [Shewanella sp. E94]WBJ95363.1 hypothetical protein HWQ47_26850 [Shewanella sp. MTB7]
MFKYTKKGSEYIVKAGEIRIHECHSLSEVSNIINRLNEGQLLRDILATNIQNLSKTQRVKEGDKLLQTVQQKSKTAKLEVKRVNKLNKNLLNKIAKLSENVESEITKEAHYDFRKEITTELYKTVVGSYQVGATLHLWDLTPKEIVQLTRYIAIFKRCNFKEHWQVNEFISNKNAWGEFDALRSNNLHANDFTAKGIYPNYYRIVYEILNISGDSGTHLVNADRY